MKCKIFLIVSRGSEEESRVSDEISSFLKGKKVIRTEQSSSVVDSGMKDFEKVQVLATHITIFYEE